MAMASVAASGSPGSWRLLGFRPCGWPRYGFSDFRTPSRARVSASQPCQLGQRGQPSQPGQLRQSSPTSQSGQPRQHSHRGQPGRPSQPSPVTAVYSATTTQATGAINHGHHWSRSPPPPGAPVTGAQPLITAYEHHQELFERHPAQVTQGCFLWRTGQVAKPVTSGQDMLGLGHDRPGLASAMKALPWYE